MSPVQAARDHPRFIREGEFNRTFEFSSQKYPRARARTLRPGRIGHHKHLLTNPDVRTPPKIRCLGSGSCEEFLNSGTEACSTHAPGMRPGKMRSGAGPTLQPPGKQRGPWPGASRARGGEDGCSKGRYSRNRYFKEQFWKLRNSFSSRGTSSPLLYDNDFRKTLLMELYGMGTPLSHHVWGIGGDSVRLIQSTKAWNSSAETVQLCTAQPTL